MTDEPRQRTEGEQRAFSEGARLAQMLSEFRSQHPQHAELSDQEIVAAADELVPTMQRTTSMLNSSDHVERKSSRGELYDKVSDKLTDPAPRTWGDLMNGRTS